ncbi:DNA-damage-inducible protein J [Paucilactobacillus suebicus DSM 5007 = KCTC 3549]|uniref:DNA-damage-inducible protein J n=2 Tax=Paucilactobacillus suebicus TaxID=152335 RepID=A0A0R1W8G2_9LACO|nr:DNA-damage-inducible protein J [Paucilactobacillus suebicus DSM 5007 = KCTC 3549]
MAQHDIINLKKGMISMAQQVKKRIQVTMDKGIAESAEFIINKAGLTPGTVISMVYAEINRTGKIPVKPQADAKDLATAKLIDASYNTPSVKLDNDSDIKDFFEDDGGY